MNVLLVDDSALFLDGLRSMLEASEIDVLGVALCAEEAIEQARRLHPEVVLMDVQMPGESGIEATRVLKTLFPQIKIVMMTVFDSDEHLFDAIAAGASGYLLKGMSPDGFLEALVGLSRGETPLSPGLAARIMAEFARRQRETGKPGAASTYPLSERQIEILRMVAHGHPYKQIAEHLNVSERTIKYHMGEIAGRLHVENRSQVLAYASRYLPDADKQIK
jgi:two-component system NarL family response regulator